MCVHAAKTKLLRVPLVGNYTLIAPDWRTSASDSPARAGQRTEVRCQRPGMLNYTAAELRAGRRGQTHFRKVRIRTPASSSPRVMSVSLISSRLERSRVAKRNAFAPKRQRQASVWFVPMGLLSPTQVH